MKKLFLNRMANCFNTCLLIDDNYIDNFVTRKILESSKFAENIVVVRSAQEAISALTDGSIQPDVIFLDVRMPGMGGFEFLEEYDKIAIEKEGVQIFMLSSSLDLRTIKKGLPIVNILLSLFINHLPKKRSKKFVHDPGCR